MFINPYLYNPLLLPPFIPYSEKPPTLYSILNSIVNFEKIEKTKIPNLAKEGRKVIFDFNYPLSNNINKEDFEVLILNKFMTRRIGFETVVNFKLHLNVKLNEIMPFYNKLFDELENWKVFDGETTEKTSKGKDLKELERTSNDKSLSNSVNEVNNESNNNSENISDRRYSDTPQDALNNVEDGSYLTTYNLDKNTNTSKDISKSTGNSRNSLENTGIINENSTSDNIYEEKSKRSVGEKLRTLIEYQDNLQKIYTLIFKDLDSLFYQVSDY